MTNQLQFYVQQENIRFPEAFDIGAIIRFHGDDLCPADSGHYFQLARRALAALSQEFTSSDPLPTDRKRDHERGR